MLCHLKYSVRPPFGMGFAYAYAVPNEEKLFGMGIALGKKSEKIFHDPIDELPMNSVD